MDPATFRLEEVLHRNCTRKRSQDQLTLRWAWLGTTTKKTSWKRRVLVTSIIREGVDGVASEHFDDTFFLIWQRFFYEGFQKMEEVGRIGRSRNSMTVLRSFYFVVCSFYR